MCTIYFSCRCWKFFLDFPRQEFTSCFFRFVNIFYAFRKICRLQVENPTQNWNKCVSYEFIQISQCVHLTIFNQFSYFIPSENTRKTLVFWKFSRGIKKESWEYLFCFQVTRVVDIKFSLMEWSFYNLIILIK